MQPTPSGLRGTGRPALRRREGITPDQQARNLGLSLGGLAYLSLCRMPRPGERDAGGRIARKVGMGADKLAKLLGYDPGAARHSALARLALTARFVEVRLGR